ncbi:DNA-directed RNA polymerase subunit alpha C-terminal domain-containing protein [Lyngbya aestuarii]|uniref:DNA-directed RNA polymerase subunit alpha C-terminal domain-containing protein n=1 Tax=Lyngbya aestuarii TaxID=118322 RepID=UPI00403D62BC
MRKGRTKTVSIDSEVVIHILRRSPHGLTSIALLDDLLAQPQYQGRTKPSLFSKLLLKLHKMRDSQVVAHISDRWTLVEYRKSSSSGINEELKAMVRVEDNLDSREDKSQPYQHQGIADHDSRDLPLEILNLPFRAYTCLKRADINTVKELQACSEQQLLGLKNFGQASLTKVRTALADFKTFLQPQVAKSKTAFQPSDSIVNTTQEQNTGLDSQIDELNLSTRAFHCLKRAGINTVRELLSCSDEDLLKISNFGQTSLSEVRTVLQRFQSKIGFLPTQKISAQPKWSKTTALQIPTRCLSLSYNLQKLINKYSAVEQLIDAFEDGKLALDSRQYAELKEALDPFKELQNAPQGYLDWLSTLSWLTQIKVLTKYQWSSLKLLELYPRQILSRISADERTKTLQAIVAKKIHSKGFDTVSEEINDCFSLLNARQRFVLKQRLGLQNGKPKLLKEIGKELKLTRETIRQIEHKSKKKLAALQNMGALLQLRKLVNDVFSSNGYFIKLQDLCAVVEQRYPSGEVHLPSVILLLIEVSTTINIIRIGENKFLYTAPISKAALSESQAMINKLLSNQKISYRSQLKELILPNLPQDIPDLEKLANTLIDNFCYQNIAGIFSTQVWNIKDYAYYVLYQAKKPLHFTQIAEQIKQLKPDWQTENIHRAAQAAIERHPDIIRCGMGIYALREWGTMEYSHFREVLFDYLNKQPLPVDANDIYAELSKSYSVSRITITSNLNLYSNLFQKFGYSNIYGVAGKIYELPDTNLLNLLVSKLEVKPLTIDELQGDLRLRSYDYKTLNLYLNASPLFQGFNSSKSRKFTLMSNHHNKYSSNLDKYNSTCLLGLGQ